MTNDIGKVGTLAELGVKVGDVVEVFGGLRWKIIGIGPDGEYLINDPPAKCLSQTLPFRIISRANTADETPKTWGEMSDAEKGTLLLAKHEGKVIEYGYSGPYFLHEKPNDGKWVEIYLYRIKPEPVVETVVMYASDKMKGFGLCRGDKSVHKLTFKKIDGEIDYTTVKMGLIEDRTGEQNDE